MPTYVFECQSCSEQLEVKQSIKEKVPNRKKCPACNQNKLELLLFAPHFFNRLGDDDIKVGHLSARNTESFSDDRKATLKEKHHTGVRQDKKEGKNFWDVTAKQTQEIANMTPEKKQKYIETGEK